MAKLTLSDIGNITTAASVINANNDATVAALENTLSRNGTAPNEMNADLDMNSKRIYNLPAPTTPTEPLRSADLTNELDAIDRAVKAPEGEAGYTLPANVDLRGKYLIVDGGGLMIGSSGVPTPVASTSITDSTALGRSILTSATDTATADLIKVGWRNIRSAKTTAYTVVDGDHGSTIALGGAALYQVTINGSGSYRANFMVELHNEDSRGKRIAITGQANFILWPGDRCTVYADGANMVRTNRNERSKGVNILYVDPVNGYGAAVGDGVGYVDGLTSAGGATTFKFIQDAITTIVRFLDCDNVQHEIRVVAAVSGQQVSLSAQGQPLGACQILISGYPTRQRWVATANGQTFVQAKDNGIITLDNFQMDAVAFTGCTFIQASQMGVVDYKRIDFQSCGSGYHILILSGGFVNCVDAAASPGDYIVSGSAIHHVFVVGNGIWLYGGQTVQCPVGMVYTSFVNMVGPGMCNGTLMTFTGVGSGGGTVGQRFALNANAVGVFGGTVFPGTVAGATTNGGVSI